MKRNNSIGFFFSVEKSRSRDGFVLYLSFSWECTKGL